MVFPMQCRYFARRFLVERKFSVSAGFSFSLAFMILFLPLQWIAAMIIAAALHELCHFLAIVILHGSVPKLRLHPYGARMSLPDLSRGKELLCALAGPLGSIALLLTASRFPRVAFCGMAQGLFNLLPIYPLDGGRMIRCLFSMIFSPPVAGKAAAFLTFFVSVTVFVVACYGTFMLDFGFLPLITAALLLFRAFSEKIPCKRTRLGVQ